MLNAVIIDDERRSREALKALIEKYTTGVKVIGVADDVTTGLKIIEKLSPAVVFLDIQLKTGTGFDLLRQIEPINFQVIFTTAYDEYAIKAFKFNAVNYLLKPIGIDELTETIEKTKFILSEQSETIKLKAMIAQLNRFDNSNPTLTISTEKSIEFLEVNEIVFIQAQGSYSMFMLKNGKKVVTSKLLKEYENLLSDFSFFRLHNSYIVNLGQVKRFIKTDGGYVEMKNGTKIPVSRRKKEQFIKSFT